MIIVLGSRVSIDGVEMTIEQAEQMYQEYLDDIEYDPAWDAFGKYLETLKGEENEQD